MRLPSFQLNGAAVQELNQDAPASTAHIRRYDWTGILRIYFTEDEASYLEATTIDGLAGRQAEEALGWSHTKARRIAKRIERKLAKGPLAKDVPTLRRPSGETYVEHLPSGKRCWAMTPPNPGEQQIMRRERIKFVYKSTT